MPPRTVESVFQVRVPDFKPETSDITVAYLVNQYPLVSHSFIRREIQALEQQGVVVHRFTIRRSDDIVDADDVAERRRTTALLDARVSGIAVAMLKTGLTHFLRFVKALHVASRLGLRSSRGLVRHWIYFGEACLLAQHLRREGIGHVHAHFGTNSTTVALLSEIVGGPGFSFTVHGGSAEFDSLDGIRIVPKIERARFVTVISSYGRSQLYRKCEFHLWPKITIVRCGLEAEYLDAPPSPVPRTHRLVCVGRLHEQKGQLILVDAIARLRDEGIEVSVTLVGDGEMRTPLEQLIHDRHLDDHIEITGWADAAEVRRQLTSARALVLPSFAEGLPVVIMEAFALGRPVITTYVGGIPELVSPGENGWLIPAGDIDSLIDAIKQVLATPVDRLSEMGRQGRERIRAQHDVMTEAAKLATLFREHARAPSGG